MGTLVSVLLTLLGVVASLGISEGVDAINRENARKGNLTPDKIISLINSKLSQIQRRSSQAFNKVMDKINNMPIVAESGSLKAYMNNVRQKYQKVKENATNNLTNVENVVSDLKNRANTLANQTDSYKTSKAGKEEYSDLMHAADQASEDFSKEVEKVEKAI